MIQHVYRSPKMIKNSLIRLHESPKEINVTSKRSLYDGVMVMVSVLKWTSDDIYNLLKKEN